MDSHWAATGRADKRIRQRQKTAVCRDDTGQSPVGAPDREPAGRWSGFLADSPWAKTGGSAPGSALQRPAEGGHLLGRDRLHETAEGGV